MKENEFNNEENNTLNSTEDNELILNTEAKKALFKSHFKYYLTNGLLICIPMFATIITYFIMDNIEFDMKFLLSIFWSILKQPSFFIPVIIAIFVKDILKYIFCGMSQDDAKFMQEAEKENPNAEGVSNVINGESAKKRFAFVSLMFGLFGILLFFIIKQLFNIKTIISLAIAYFYTAHKFTLAYGDFQQIILNKTFLIVFLISLCVLNLFFKKQKVEIEENSGTEDASEKIENK